MRVYLDQIGCRLNYSEMETLAGRLRSAGHNMVSTPEDAQVIVFNTCAVTHDAVRGSRKQIRQFHTLNPNARIAVTGCWAALEPNEASALPGVSLVANNSQKEFLHTLLEPWSADFDTPDNLARIQPDGMTLEFASESVVSGTVIPLQSLVSDLQSPISDSQLSHPRRTRAFIKVQDGCNNKCTFCIVTLARGDSRSRAIGDIVSEVQGWVTQGVQEAVLTGVHLGSYGRDLVQRDREIEKVGDWSTIPQPNLSISQSINLKDLVSAILTNTDIPRLRLSSLEPWEMSDGFFELWQQWPGRLCPHLHLPLQAGTDKQLRAMARRCTTASFRQLVADARTAIPDLILTSDLIVGFPGESESDFAQGLDFVAEMRFAHAHVFPFSARTGTAAANFSGQLTGDVKKERGRRMRDLVEKTGQSERRRFIGTTRPVLWEGEGQPLTDQPGLLWSGLTDNYLRVMAVASEGIELHNRITSTQLDELQGDVLYGTIV